MLSSSQKYLLVPIKAQDVGVDRIRRLIHCGHMSMRMMSDSPDFPRFFEPLMDSKQAAALVMVHPKTLQRYARNGLVVGLRVGKYWRFRASDLDRSLPLTVSSRQLSVPPQHPEREKK